MLVGATWLTTGHKKTRSVTQGNGEERQMARERTVDGAAYTFSECITCGVTYAVPSTMWDTQTKLGGFHHCSNGHRQGWDKEHSENEKLRRERDRLKQQTAQLEDEAREARVRAERAEAATKRLKKRTAAGTCPCCKRTFSNMNIHMRKEHPQFVAENVVQIKRTTG